MDWEEGPCFLCELTVEARHNPEGTIFQFKCPHCGHFTKTYQGTVTLEDRIRCDPKNPEVKAKIVGWIRRQNRQGKTPTIDADKIRELVEATPPTTKQRAVFLLEEAIFGRSEVELEIVPTEQRFLNANYSINSQEVSSLLSYFEEENFVKSVTPKSATITVKGKIKAEKLLGIESA